VRDLTVLDRKAPPPADFDPEKYELSAFGIHPGGTPATYVLRFQREVAPYIRERVWHPSQALRELRGGRVELTFTCGESFEVTSWVASWREWVEVVEPPALRRQLGRLGRWLGRAYGASRPTAKSRRGGRARP
jgi:predicted DNA-binding transcriptional regulator YafY